MYVYNELHAHYRPLPYSLLTDKMVANCKSFNLLLIDIQRFSCPFYFFFVSFTTKIFLLPFCSTGLVYLAWLDAFNTLLDNPVSILFLFQGGKKKKRIPNSNNLKINNFCFFFFCFVFNLESSENLGIS